MIHFNELNISEDGKHLTIDTEIDNFEVFNGCYIDNIVVDTADDYCNGHKSKAVTVYKNDGYTTQYDMDGDGKISDMDCILYNRLIELISKLKDNDAEQYNKFDVNRDGVVDLKDYNAIVDVISANKPAVPGYNYDVNEDEEISLGDVNALRDYIISMGQNTLTPEEYKEFSRLFDMYKSAHKIDTKTADTQRHIRLCLDWCDIPGLVTKKSDFNKQMFIVTVTASCDGSIGIASLHLGCGWDNNVIIGAAINTKPIYDSAVRYASSIGDKCDPTSSAQFEDFILRYYAFDFALKSGNICQAWYYYNNYISGNQSSVSSYHKCCCHGARI